MCQSSERLFSIHSHRTL